MQKRRISIISFLIYYGFTKNASGDEPVFESINFRNCEVLFLEKDSSFFKEDLLQARFPNGRLIDVGWYGKDCSFCIQVIEDTNSEKTCYKTNRFKVEWMEKDIQNFIDYETIEYTDEISSLFFTLENFIKTREDKQQPYYNDATQILEKLHSLGLEQNEVANYIQTFALQYRESDENNWDFACDLLDLVTGFCAPKKHIWHQ